MKHYYIINLFEEYIKNQPLIYMSELDDRIILIFGTDEIYIDYKNGTVCFYEIDNGLSIHLPEINFKKLKKNKPDWIGLYMNNENFNVLLGYGNPFTKDDEFKNIRKIPFDLITNYVENTLDEEFLQEKVEIDINDLTEQQLIELEKIFEEEYSPLQIKNN